MSSSSSDERAEAALLEAVLASPDDDAPRLVAADWYSERGDPRGELITLQCERSRLTMDDPRRAALEDREMELLRRHQKRWTAPLEALGQKFYFQRGFVQMALCDVEQLIARGSELFGRAPIQHVAVRPRRGEVARLANTPLLRRLRSLEVVRDLGDEEVRVLARSPHLGALRVLQLECNRIGDAGAEALAASDGLGALEELNLDRNRIGGPGARALAESARLPGVRLLELRGNRLGDDGARALAEATGLPRLEALGLGWNEIGVEGAAALSRSSVVARLHTLSLGLVELQDLPYRLSGVNLDDGAWEPMIPELHQMAARINDEPGSNALGDDGVAHLAASSGLRGLHTLSLSHCGLGDEAARSLAASPHLAQLRQLDLCANHITDGGAAALAGAPHLAGLTLLDLRHNQGMAAEGLPQMARYPQVGAWLRKLAARRSLSRKGDAALLLRSLGQLHHLETLDVGDNPTVGKEVPSLVGSLGSQQRLRTLILDGCKIDATGARLLAKALPPTVTVLDLSNNPIGDKGARALAAAPTMSHLTSLRLRGCGLTSDGAGALVASFHLAGLGRLSVGDPAATAGLKRRRLKID